ncbi:RluA family pseudouridine synthase [Hydrogenimonas urashimensis]|uniref:RluA family pseudouridine synthase n=1 Tax=Hydrogenimonas urashimensis TaxID=2740515 RepID=UPI0019150F3C|nr:RluA family pseudouridine synthase [Hydrogenimonas urashimensis]
MKKESLTKSLTVETSQRLDRFLHSRIGGSRNQIERLIKRGFVEIDGKIVKKAGYRVSSGQVVRYTIPEEPDYVAASVDFEVPIIYEDEHILVINKPSGLVVHPAPSVREPTLVDWLKARGVNLSTISGEERHGIVHRLDKETSGAMVVAKNNTAHERLSRQLQEKTMGRYYVALVDLPLKASGIVEGPIGRNPANRLKMGVVSGGKPARTRFEKLLMDEKSRYELVGAKLYTGRTHQIRVHLASLNRHIVGDSLYGFKSKNNIIQRILLHAYILYLDHPATGKTMQFTAPIPKDMWERLENCFEKERLDEILDPCSFLRRFGDHCDRMFHEGGDRSDG